jgi:hypothetical protein
MSQITEMRIGFTRTINLGNFESAKIEASVTVSVEPDEDTDAVLKRMQIDLRTMVEETWKAQHKSKKEG